LRNDNAATSQNHIVALQLTIASGPDNPVAIATPKINVIGEHDVYMSNGEPNKQFIENENLANEGELTIGTTESCIIKSNHSALEKTMLLVGHDTEFQTGGFRIKEPIEQQSSNRE
tara:strand:- start:298 stop:645 length:348 start_codon:yes stop_codon:yes gene_type:complete